MSDLTEWRPGETTAQWVERVTGEILTANQTAAVDALLHRSALAGETEQETMEKAVAQTKGMEAPEEHDCTSRDIDAEIDGCAVGQECDGYWEAWFRARLEAAAPILTAPLLVQLQDKEEKIALLEAKLSNADHDLERLRDTVGVLRSEKLKLMQSLAAFTGGA